MDKEIIKKIYNDIFLYIQHSNIDLFYVVELVINHMFQTEIN